MKISYKTYKSCVRTIRNTDDNFLIKDGFTVTPRAGFEISSRCPYSYRQVIQECFQQGWLKPVANVYDYELTLDLLKN
jgi:hypothetical protein